MTPPMSGPVNATGRGTRLDVVVIGGGQAGLAMAWHLTQRGLRFVVLEAAGETVEILLDVTNPGLWMAHCHIAEHNQSGMMFSFRVDRSA